MKKEVHSVQDMHTFAAEVASEISGGEVLGLQGDLGTGKTEFVRGLAKALGSTDAVKSPSFTLLNVYRTMHPTIRFLIHVDLYRLEGASENLLEQIGLDEWLGRKDSLIVIEWTERLPASISQTRTLLFFYDEKEIDRVVEMK